MNHKRFYQNNPRPMIAKYSGHCSQCQQKVKPGDPIIYWPITKGVQHESCGSGDYKRHLEEVFDEQVLGVR